MKISPEDQELVDKYEWRVNSRGYIVRRGRNNSQNYLHHLIIGKPKKGFVVDHIDGDKENNTRENLRICKQAENCANSKISKNNTSGFKGVSWNKALKKWHAYIMLNRKRIHLGYFKDKLEAAKAYNKAALKYFGEFARLNEVAI